MPSDEANPYVGTRGKLHEEPERKLEVLVDKAVLSAVLPALKQGHPYEEPAYDVVALENTNPLIGLGRVGTLDGKMTGAALADMVRTNLDLNHVRLMGDAKKKIKTVAVMGGAGGSEIGKIPGHVDAYVTGDVKYHDALLAVERGLVVIDAGHCGTERGVAELIAKYLKSKHKGLKTKAILEQDVFQVFGSGGIL